MVQTLKPLTDKCLAPEGSPLRRAAVELLETIPKELPIEIGLFWGGKGGRYFYSRIDIRARTFESKHLVCQYQSRDFLPAKTQYSIAGIALNQAVEELQKIIREQSSIRLAEMIMRSDTNVEPAELI